MKKIISLLVTVLLLFSFCSVGVSAAYGNYMCDGFSYSLLDSKAIITGYYLDTEILYIPDVLDGNKVFGIADRAFADNSHIQKVLIAEGVESIGEYAFYNCPNLNSVTVSGSKTKIGNKAFCYKPFYKDGEYWADTTIDEDEITFYGYGYSDLKRYAKTYGYKYVDLGYDSYKRGDVDFDRVVTVKDATAIQKSLAGITYFLKNRQKLNADFNRDKLIDIKDATAIQKHIAGLDYYMDTRRVYIDAPQIWSGSYVYVRCTATGYLNDENYPAKYDENTGLFYADVPAIMDAIEIGSDYEAEVYSSRITVPEEEYFHIECTSYQNWGLWTEYEWEIVNPEPAFVK